VNILLFFTDETNLLVDHQTYYLDLKTANRLGHVNMTLEYSAKADLDLEDMSPESWANYVKYLSVDEMAFTQFRQVSERNIKKNCHATFLFFSTALLQKWPRFN
jgi:hypothetical protein